MSKVFLHKPMHTFLPRLLAILGATILASCSLAPVHENPALPVAEQWPQELSTAMAAASTEELKPLPWREFFTEPTLQQLIAQALENNRDLRVAALNVQRLEAQWRIQGAAQFPGLNANLQTQRQSPRSGGNNANIGIGIPSFELDFFGRIQNLKDAALAQYLASEESRRTVQMGLIAGITSSYLDLLTNNELLQLAEHTLKTRGETLRLVRLKSEHGMASELDLRQSEALTESARANHAASGRRLQQSRHNLLLLLGQKTLPEELSKMPSLSGLEPLLAEIPAGLPSDLIIRRPDIREAEQQLIAANANIGAARAAFFPRISLTGSLGFASKDLSNLFNDTTRGWTHSTSAVLPIFNAGSNLANLDVAKISKEISVAQYEKAIQTAFREVADALAGLASWQQQLEANRGEMQAMETAYQLSDLRYRSGLLSHLELLDVQRSLFASQQTTIQTQAALLQNRIQLYKALGGGWEENESEHAQQHTH